MFALMPVNGEQVRINLKCDPFVAQGLREKYKSIIPGYHMNKTHWNTVIIDDSISNDVIRSMIDDSYDLVFFKLTKKTREAMLQGKT